MASPLQLLRSKKRAVKPLLALMAVLWGLLAVNPCFVAAADMPPAHCMPADGSMDSCPALAQLHCDLPQVMPAVSYPPAFALLPPVPSYERPAATVLTRGSPHYLRTVLPSPPYLRSRVLLI